MNTPWFRSPRLIQTVLAGGMLAVAPGAVPQVPSAPAAYRLQFFVHESGSGKPERVHAYTLLLASAKNGGSASLRVGGRVPVRSDGEKYTYTETGLNLDCSLTNPNAETNGELALHITLQLTNLAPNSTPGLPVFSTATTSSWTLVPLGQRVSVSRFENPNSDAVYELEVLAEAAAAPAAASGMAPQ